MTIIKKLEVIIYIVSFMEINYWLFFCVRKLIRQMQLYFSGIVMKAIRIIKCTAFLKFYIFLANIGVNIYYLLIFQLLDRIYEGGGWTLIREVGFI